MSISRHHWDDSSRNESSLAILTRSDVHLEIASLNLPSSQHTVSARDNHLPSSPGFNTQIPQQGVLVYPPSTPHIGGHVVEAPRSRQYFWQVVPLTIPEPNAPTCVIPSISSAPNMTLEDEFVYHDHMLRLATRYASSTPSPPLVSASSLLLAPSTFSSPVMPSRLTVTATENPQPRGCATLVRKKRQEDCLLESPSQHLGSRGCRALPKPRLSRSPEAPSSSPLVACGRLDDAPGEVEHKIRLRLPNSAQSASQPMYPSQSLILRGCPLFLSSPRDQRPSFLESATSSCTSPLVHAKVASQSFSLAHTSSSSQDTLISGIAETSTSLTGSSLLDASTTSSCSPSPSASASSVMLSSSAASLPHCGTSVTQDSTSTASSSSFSLFFSSPSSSSSLPLRGSFSDNVSALSRSRGYPAATHTTNAAMSTTGVMASASMQMLPAAFTLSPVSPSASSLILKSASSLTSSSTSRVARDQEYVFSGPPLPWQVITTSSTSSRAKKFVASKCSDGQMLYDGVATAAQVLAPSLFPFAEAAFSHIASATPPQSTPLTRTPNTSPSRTIYAASSFSTCRATSVTKPTPVLPSLSVHPLSSGALHAADPATLLSSGISSKAALSIHAVSFMAAHAAQAGVALATKGARNVSSTDMQTEQTACFSSTTDASATISSTAPVTAASVSASAQGNPVSAVIVDTNTSCTRSASASKKHLSTSASSLLHGSSTSQATAAMSAISAPSVTSVASMAASGVTLSTSYKPALVSTPVSANRESTSAPHMHHSSSPSPCRRAMPAAKSRGTSGNLYSTIATCTSEGAGVTATAGMGTRKSAAAGSTRAGATTDNTVNLTPERTPTGTGHGTNAVSRAVVRGPGTYVGSLVPVAARNSSFPQQVKAHPGAGACKCAGKVMDKGAGVGMSKGARKGMGTGPDDTRGQPLGRVVAGNGAGSDAVSASGAGYGGGSRIGRGSGVPVACYRYPIGVSRNAIRTRNNPQEIFKAPIPEEDQEDENDAEYSAYLQQSVAVTSSPGDNNRHSRGVRYFQDDNNDNNNVDNYVVSVHSTRATQGSFRHIHGITHGTHGKRHSIIATIDFDRAAHSFRKYHTEAANSTNMEGHGTGMLYKNSVGLINVGGRKDSQARHVRNISVINSTATTTPSAPNSAITAGYSVASRVTRTKTVPTGSTTSTVTANMSTGSAVKAASLSNSADSTVSTNARGVAAPNVQFHTPSVAALHVPLAATSDSITTATTSQTPSCNYGAAVVPTAFKGPHTQCDRRTVYSESVAATHVASDNTMVLSASSSSLSSSHSTAVYENSTHSGNNKVISRLSQAPAPGPPVLVSAAADAIAMPPPSARPARTRTSESSRAPPGYGKYIQKRSGNSQLVGNSGGRRVSSAFCSVLTISTMAEDNTSKVDTSKVMSHTSSSQQRPDTASTNSSHIEISVENSQNIVHYSRKRTIPVSPRPSMEAGEVLGYNQPIVVIKRTKLMEHPSS